MKVSELIAVLQTLPAEADVQVEYGGTLDTGFRSVDGAHHERDQYDLDGNNLDVGTVYLDI